MTLTAGFAAFRGTLDVNTPMKITILSQMVNMVLDPIFIFGLGGIKAMGVAGAAIATGISEAGASTRPPLTHSTYHPPLSPPQST